jgi:hypothetical protein
MGANVIESARKAPVDRLLFLGSRCIYPKFAPRSLQEDSLLTGTLEPTNRRYAFGQNRRNRDVNRQLSAILMVQDRRQLRSKDIARNPGVHPQDL